MPHVSKEIHFSFVLSEQMDNWKDNLCYSMLNELVNEKERDFSGGSVVMTLCFHCTGHEFDPCLGN